jgi:SAM-dependent methyltransferase
MRKLVPPTIFSESEALDEICVTLREAVRSRSPSVLEAGCGRKTPFDLGDDAVVVGIDIEPLEIGRNGRLSEAIVGDIQTYPILADSFDIAVCWNVLEHLEHPELALANIRKGLRPGGIFVIGVPHLRSLKTQLVKMTPAWLHRRVWHWLYWYAAAEDGPFPVVHSERMSVAEIERFARANSMTVLCSKGYESALQAHLRERLHIGDWLWGFLHAACAGRLDVLHSDRVIILQC